MLTDLTAALQNRGRGNSSDTWPPYVLDAVVDLLAEILVREFQSTRTISSVPGLTFSEIQGHRPDTPEDLGA